MSACALFLLVTIAVNGPLSPLLPAAYEPILIYFGPLLGPFTTAALGTVGTVSVEYVNYRLHQKLLETRAAQRITGGRLVRLVVTRFSRRPAFTVWLCAWSPLPYWPVRLLSPLARLSLQKHLVATALGRFPQYLVVIWLGAQLRLSTGALAAIVTATTLVTALVWLADRLRRAAAVVGVVVLLALPGRTAHAQRADSRIADGKAVGVTVDRFKILGDEDRYTTFTVHLTQLNAGGLSPNVGLGIFPTLLPVHQIASVLDGGIGYNISLPRTTILPHLGATSLAAFGPYRSAAVVGYQIGVSILVNFGRTDAIRLDLTRREYFEQNDRPRSSLTLGIGISGVQPRKATGAQ